MLHSAVATKPKRGVFGVLDIGTTKTLCMVVRMNGITPEIVGVGYRVSEGINGGTVLCMDDATNSILSAIDTAEKASGETIDQVYINVAGCGIRSFFIGSETSSASHEMSERDIRRIIAQTYEKCPSKSVIVHNFPLCYSLDEMEDIRDPKGLYGTTLKVRMHAVIASRQIMTNIEHCLNGCSLNMGGCSVSGYSSGISCLTPDERDLGSVVIDIGGGNTSVGVFERGKFVYASYVPFGGLHVTRDIAWGLGISIAGAEKVKILHGNAVSIPSDPEFIELYGVSSEEDDGQECLRIPNSVMVAIIRARTEEILEMVRDDLEKSKVKVRHVVLTGGGSSLRSIREVAELIFRSSVRLGTPVFVEGLCGEYGRSCMFSAAVGTVMAIAGFYTDDAEHRADSGLVRKVLSIFGHGKA